MKITFISKVLQLNFDPDTFGFVTSFQSLCERDQFIRLVSTLPVIYLEFLPKFYQAAYQLTS